MPIYKAPVDNVVFLLKDVLGYERCSNLPGFADAPIETVEAVLGEAGRFCEEVLQPLNRSGDDEGCTRHPDGSVTTPAGFKEAYQNFAEAGWVGLAADPQSLDHFEALTADDLEAARNWLQLDGDFQTALETLGRGNGQRTL